MTTDSAVFTATVIASAPDVGWALVTRDRGDIKLRNLVVAYMPYADSAYGAAPLLQPPSGSSVLCAGVHENPHMAYILGVVDMDVNEQPKPLGDSLFYRVGKFISAEAKAINPVLEQLVKSATQSIFKARKNASGDTLPGDYDITDKEGLVGLHIGRLLASLYGSPLAFIDVSAVSHKVRVVGTSVEIHTLIGEQVLNDAVHIENIAATPREAVGILNEEKQYSMIDSIEGALPFFRQQDMAGPAVGGYERSIQTPPIEQSGDVHDKDVQPLLLYKHRTSIYGEDNTQSTHSISSVKTPDIKGILQTQYDKNAEYPRELRTQVKSPEIIKPSSKANKVDSLLLVEDAALHQVNLDGYLDDNFFGYDYTPDIQTRLAEEGMSIASDTLRNKLKKTAAPDYTASGMGLPPTIAIKDPCTGVEHTYFASTSFIKQTDDGSILIADGYGSEIRMCRGNIYIASALDTFVRPGRDCVTMAPRNLVLNTNGRGVINTSDTLHVRARGSLHMVSDAGSVTIDGRALSGVVIRSHRDLSLTCSGDMYIGRNDHSSTDSDSVSAPTGPGVVVIDAADNGVLYQKGRDITTQAASTLISVVANSSEKTAVGTITSGNSMMVGGHVRFFDTVTVRTSSFGEVCTLTEGKKLQAYSFGYNKTAVVTVDGPVITYGALKVNSFIEASSVTAGTVVSVSMGTIDDKYAPKTETPDAEERPKIDSNNSQALWLSDAFVYSDLGAAGNPFTFPSSADYGISEDLRMPLMLWQSVSVSTSKWDEIPVVDPGSNGSVSSYCYPGELWETASIGDSSYGKKPLQNNYVINKAAN